MDLVWALRGSAPVLILGVLSIGLSVWVILLMVERRKRAQSFNLSLRYKTAFEQSQMGVAISNSDGTAIDVVNKEFARMHGYHPSELIGHSAQKILSPRSQEKVFQIIQKARDLGSYTTETLRLRKDGTEFPAITTLTCFSSPDVKSKGFVVNVIDITERKRTETLNRAQAAQLRTLFDTIPDLLWLKDASGIFLACNHRFELLMGAKEEEILGKTDYDFFESKVANFFQETDRAAIVAGGPSAHEKEVTFASDGHKEYLETIKTPIFTEEGNLLGILGIGRDISGRKRDLEALKQSEDKFMKAFKASPEAISIVMIEDETYWEVNDAFLKKTGLSRDEVIGHSASDIGFWLRPEDRQMYFAEYSKTNSLRDYEVRLRMSSGEIRTFLANSEQVEINDKGCRLNYLLDITELRQMEEEKTRLKTQLLQSQKMESLGRLAGGIAHDMNNVFAAILALASAQIVKLVADDPFYRTFETIMKASERGGQTVRSLLSFARLTPVEEKELNLNTIINEETRLLELSTLSKVHLKMELAPELKTIVGDANALAHAIMNLCVNAADAMPESGALTIRTLNIEHNWVEVQVQDKGIGMPKDVLEKAFDPFFTTKPMGKGTGLGLSIVYGVVQSHHGKMEIESEPGQGTTVRLKFPAKKKGKNNSELQGNETGDLALPTLNVLVVDDDELVLFTVQEILANLGHHITTASRGEEAFRKLAIGPLPDVIILDLNMPGLSGSEILLRLERQYPTIPVLISTGRTDRVAAELVQAHPRATLLSKPYRLEELNTNLQKIFCKP